MSALEKPRGIKFRREEDLFQLGHHVTGVLSLDAVVPCEKCDFERGEPRGLDVQETIFQILPETGGRPVFDGKTRTFGDLIVFGTKKALELVAETKDVASGTGKVVEIEGRSIALFNVAGAFHAIDNACTHEAGPLGEGALVGEIVTCPWHATEFNVRTGEALGPLGDEGVRSFPVKVQGDDVLVELD